MEKINIHNKLDSFSEFWQPRIIAQVNDTEIKVVKLKDDFIWHTHELEDEMFIVVKGKLTIKFRDKDIILEEGEGLTIPRGVEHKPVAESEVHVLLIEPKGTVNTGNVESDRTYHSANTN